MASEFVIYSVDANPFSNFGVGVSGSKGLFDTPTVKQVESTNWQSYHGEALILSEPKFQAREITLQCYIISEDVESRTEFNGRLQDFKKAMTARPYVELRVHAVNDTFSVIPFHVRFVELEVTEKIKPGVGRFELKLVESIPVKRVYFFDVTDNTNRTAVIGVTTSRLVNIFWGDGTMTTDVFGTSSRNHVYQQNQYGRYYITVYGDIKNATFTGDTNASLLWEMLF